MQNDARLCVHWWARNASRTIWRIWSECWPTTSSCYIATRLPSAPSATLPSMTGPSVTMRTGSKTSEGHPISSSTIPSDARTSVKMAAGRPANTSYTATMRTRLSRFYSTHCTTSCRTVRKRRLQTSTSAWSIKSAAVTRTPTKRKSSAIRC